MGYILASHDLRNCLHTIKKSSFKWDNFIDGFARRMKEEASNGNVSAYVPGFVSLLNADSDKVTHYIHKKDWEGLVRYLM